MHYNCVAATSYGMNYRTQKRVIIALSTLVAATIFAWGVFGLWIFIKPSAPETPPSNGGSEVVELEEIEISFEGFTEVKPEVYDALAFITNPNTEHGAAEVTYEFVFEDAQGDDIYSIEGKTFILPAQSRYIIKPAIKIANTPDSIKFRILSARWERLHPFLPLGLSISDPVLSRKEAAGTTNFSGVVKNRSPYNLQNIEVQVVLFNEGGDVFATGVTNMQTLLRGTDRFFQITWPSVLAPENVIDARVESNFLKNSNFIREYGTPQKFQEYY